MGLGIIVYKSNCRHRTCVKMHVDIFVKVVHLTYTYFQRKEQCLHTYNPPLSLSLSLWILMYYTATEITNMKLIIFIYSLFLYFQNINISHKVRYPTIHFEIDESWCVSSLDRYVLCSQH